VLSSAQLSGWDPFAYIGTAAGVQVTVRTGYRRPPYTVVSVEPVMSGMVI